MKTYSELIKFHSFEERYEYLRLYSSVGIDTFGFDRYLNQALYNKSEEWKRARNNVILRDKACDLGLDGYDILGQKIIVHHMNPITQEQILKRDPIIFDPEYLICTSIRTHNAIHYGKDKMEDYNKIVERYTGDTIPWKQASLSPSNRC